MIIDMQVECPECNGDGGWEADVKHGYATRTGSIWVKCERCDGDGWIMSFIDSSENYGTYL